MECLIAWRSLAVQGFQRPNKRVEKEDYVSACKPILEAVTPHSKTLNSQARGGAPVNLSCMLRSADSRQGKTHGPAWHSVCRYASKLHVFFLPPSPPHQAHHTTTTLSPIVTSLSQHPSSSHSASSGPTCSRPRTPSRTLSSKQRRMSSPRRIGSSTWRSATRYHPGEKQRKSDFLA